MEQESIFTFISYSEVCDNNQIVVKLEKLSHQHVWTPDSKYFRIEVFFDTLLFIGKELFVCVCDCVTNEKKYGTALFCNKPIGVFESIESYNNFVDNLKKGELGSQLKKSDEFSNVRLVKMICSHPSPSIF